VSSLPLSQMFAWGPISVEGRTPPAGEEFINADMRMIGGDYFRVMEIPLVKGRWFNEHDTDENPRVTIVDEREGSMRNDIYEMSKDPTKKAERTKLMAGRQVTYPAKLETGKWYTLVVETVGDTMRVTIDGTPAGFLKSPGIGHATKSKIELGVAGKDGFFDEIKVWNAEPAKP